MLKFGRKHGGHAVEIPRSGGSRWPGIGRTAGLAIALPTLIFVALGLQSGISAGSDRSLPDPDLTVSANSRYFIDAAGEPFFWMADTAWSMPINLSREEVLEYLDKRAAQGFNVIQTVAIFNQAGGPGPNRYGDWPYGIDLSELALTDGAEPGDADQYDYWDHLDYIVSEANARGLRVALVPIWAHGEIGTILTAANATAYGEFIGARYGRKQVIWVLGGDDPADGYEDVWRALARGVAIGVTGRENYQSLMMTYHPIGGSSSTRWFLGDQWLGFDMIQGGHCLRYNERRDLLAAAYATSPTRPFLDGEPIYSGHPYCWDRAPDGYSTPTDVRRDAYWGVFAGAAGASYGDHSVWQFMGSTARPGELGALDDWRTAMDDPAAWQMRYLVDLMMSHPWWKGVPDNHLVVGQTRANISRLQAITAIDKSYALTYSPDGQEFDANVAARIGTSSMSWYDPRTGESIPLGVVSKGDITYRPPTAEDWVLVADALATAPS